MTAHCVTIMTNSRIKILFHIETLQYKCVSETTRVETNHVT